MNLPLFLARTVARSGGRSLSRTIIGIAVAAVGISVATMILASALVNGFKNEIADKIFGFWGHIHVTDVAATQGLFASFNYPISNQQDFYPHLDTTGRVTYYAFGGNLGLGEDAPVTTEGGIEHIQQFIMLPGLASTYETTDALVLKGIAEDFDWSRFGQYIVEGQPLTVSPDSTARGIVISTITAARLRLGLGDRLDFIVPNDRGETRIRVFRVHGIYKTGMAEFDRQFALVDIKQPRRLLNWREDEIGGFEITIDELDDLEAMTEYIHLDVLSQNLYASSIESKLDFLFNWLKIQDYNGVIILILMTIVAVINMMTAVLILILERTKMIGTLKALGQRNWSIRMIFLYYAGLIILAGLVVGNLLGLGLAGLQKRYGLIQLDEESYYLNVAPIDVDWWQVAGLNAGTLVVILLFLIIPSYLVTTIDPVRAIRFK